MSTNVHYINESRNNRPISATLNEAKEELKQFAETRLAMLQGEIKEKIALVKSSAPLLAVGALLGITAFWVLTGALICALRMAFGESPYGWFLSFLIVSVFYAIIGFAALMLGYQRITKGKLVPERTIKVLKEDKVWLQNEARSQV
jgi:hypothetical protein